MFRILQLKYKHVFIPLLLKKQTYYLLSPRCRVLLEKLTGLQLVKQFPAFYRTRRFITAHKPSPPVPILGQPNPVHIHSSHHLEIHPNIIPPSMPRSPQWSPSLRFPHQDLIHSPFLIHKRHMPSPSRLDSTHELKRHLQHVINALLFKLVFLLVCS